MKNMNIAFYSTCWGLVKWDSSFSFLLSLFLSLRKSKELMTQRRSTYTNHTERPKRQTRSTFSSVQWHIASHNLVRVTFTPIVSLSPFGQQQHEKSFYFTKWNRWRGNDIKLPCFLPLPLIFNFLPHFRKNKNDMRTPFILTVSLITK